MATLKKSFFKRILKVLPFIDRINLSIARITLLLSFYVLVALFVSIIYNLVVVPNITKVLLQSLVLVIIKDFNSYLGGKL